MCLLTYVPAGRQPDALSLRYGALSNGDGHGFAIVIPKTPLRPAFILRRRGLDGTEMIEQFMIARERHPEGPALFHSRWTTHGSNGKDNCHPFYVGGQEHTVVAHNGVLPEVVQPGKGDLRSDTRIFAEDLLTDSMWGPLDTRAARRRLSKWMGSWNKILILTVDPARASNAYLINERYGQWDGGIWYSNDSYRPYTPKWTVSQTGWADEDSGWKVTNRNRCDTCLALGTVNPWTLVCDACRSCQDCGGVERGAETDEYPCLCYTPAALDRMREADCEPPMGAPGTPGRWLP